MIQAWPVDGSAVNVAELSSTNFRGISGPPSMLGGFVSGYSNILKRYIIKTELAKYPIIRTFENES